MESGELLLKQPELLSKQYAQKYRFWQNVMLIPGVISWATCLTLMCLAPQESDETFDDGFTTCGIPDWLWVSEYDPTVLTLLVVGTFSWLFSGIFKQGVNRDGSIHHYSSRSTEAFLSGPYHFVSIGIIISVAAIMLVKGFGPDLGGDTVCDAWNQPEGDERKIFGAVWGGLLSTSVLTFTCHIAGMYNYRQSLVEQEKERPKIQA